MSNKNALRKKVSNQITYIKGRIQKTLPAGHLNVKLAHYDLNKVSHMLMKKKKGKSMIGLLSISNNK